MGLRILHLEDNESDSGLVSMALARAGLDCEIVRVENGPQFRSSLSLSTFDLILSDFSLPSYDGLSGLREARMLAANTPFVFFSGTMGEIRAVEALRTGAADFVVKTDLHRLPDAVRRALADAQRAEALRADEGFRLLFDKHPQPTWVLQRETQRFLEVNEAAVEQYGYSREAFLSMTVADVCAPGERRRRGDWSRARGPRATPVARAWTHQTSAGRPLQVEILGYDLVYRGEPATLVVVQDVSERSRLQQQLLQSQRVEAVGRLAGGIAHDFNNALGVIGGYTDLLLRAQEVGDSNRRRLLEIARATDRAAGLTRQLLAFSRKQDLQPRVLALGAVVSNIEGMLRPLIGEDVHLVVTAEDGLGRVCADAGQLEQVIINLAVNARDAMPGGGTLTLQLANLDLDQASAASAAGAPPGRYVMLAMSDTGLGMDPDTLSRVFEPFFTTKEPGQGTGIGLATVHGIVEQSGGYISARSQRGQGSVFAIYLPRVDGPVEEPAAPSEDPLPRGSETILLVEDEEALRDVLAEILAGQGYEVMAAGSASAALEALERRSGPVHMLLTDLVMPGMSGGQLAQFLAERYAGLRLLFMSGYTDDVVIRQRMVDSDIAFLEKPFTLDTIVRRVRHLLDRPA